MTPDREKIEAAHRDCEPFLQMTDDMKSSPTCGAEVLGYVVWKHRETIDRLLAEALEAQMAGGWIPITDEFITGSINGKGPFLVTNNPYAKNAHGKMSHVWCVFLVHKNPEGNTGLKGLYYALNGPYSLTHYKSIDPPQEG